jgi:hypothetical protein
MVTFYLTTDPAKHICELQICIRDLLTIRTGLAGHVAYSAVRNATELFELTGVNAVAVYDEINCGQLKDISIIFTPTTFQMKVLTRKCVNALPALKFPQGHSPALCTVFSPHWMSGEGTIDHKGFMKGVFHNVRGGKVAFQAQTMDSRRRIVGDGKPHQGLWERRLQFEYLPPGMYEPELRR